ncbi:poly-beta-1,6-N-acetyl-D-glucosamine N-deacetylase PgaB [Methylococcus sp. EFPC2]|uniref:poly-beta-1,6-N-acetyl-D-glucosamine N-deacetylase PgaB n=1 Tax=Methylococcus sp. EFPC2 TaxID=2812648 RepID=UPI001968027D|nr:poly-beta-1,6-N-acetyl-D-glucosamine N-deacetylase PgaB [Methylococcus sp. EFPC2]QSA98455.1 poly-beta-1,6-N-acetyl-D-glucosamine N-deacetylase PgaB [Methylococcus sp. EFPC2]
MLLALVLRALPVYAAEEFVVLSYHDVKDEVAKDIRAGQTAVSTANLIAQFDWLKNNGYHVVSVQDLLNAKAGRRALPQKAVLLTFDDGYANVYHKVFPLLKKYRYPATIALVGKWMDSTARDPDVPVETLLSWEQVREMSRSGLVEVASHSYDLHLGLLGNPQGNEQPAGVTRIYDPQSKLYEQDTAYQHRIREEMRRASESIFHHVGVKPRAIVWPYGESNRALIEAARDVGMGVTFVLRDGKNTTADLSLIQRMLVSENPDIADFSRMMTTLRVGDRPLHVVHVDMDYVYDPDPVQTEHNLDALIDRIQGMRVNTVYLQAFSDPDGDGNAEALYFPNRHLPMRADLFNRVAWQLLTRARVKVYAWMPVLAYRLNAPDNWFVHEWKDGKPQLASHIYKRLSPFNPDARRVVGEIYEDLATHCSFGGILFHDDAILSDYEDVTAAGLAAARRWKLPTDEAHLRGDAATRMKWAKRKTQALLEWTDFLTEKVRYWRPDIKTARNYYALPLLQPDSEEWYAQSYATGLKHYDYVAIEAMPLMEKAENPKAWMDELLKKAAAYPDGLRKTVFELQSVDWNTQQEIPMTDFIAQIQQVQRSGGIHIGYYPDNVFHDHPRQEDMERVYALPHFP